jgi:hypothetical protein
VGPRAGLDAVVKRKIPSPHRESNPRTPIVQPIAQRNTNRAIIVSYVIYQIPFVVRFMDYASLSFKHFGRTPWMGGRPIAGPLPAQQSTIQERQTYIHASKWIRTHDLSVPVVKVRTFLTKRSRRHQNQNIITVIK